MKEKMPLSYQLCMIFLLIEQVMEDLVIGKNTGMTQNGEQIFLWICPKGHFSNLAKWSIEQVKEDSPHLVDKGLECGKPPYRRA